jgi:hypothetical protein
MSLRQARSTLLPLCTSLQLVEDLSDAMDILRPLQAEAPQLQAFWQEYEVRTRWGYSMAQISRAHVIILCSRSKCMAGHAGMCCHLRPWRIGEGVVGKSSMEVKHGSKASVGVGARFVRGEAHHCLQSFDGIVQAADGIVVARGDLGAQVSCSCEGVVWKMAWVQCRGGRGGKGGRWCMWAWVCARVREHVQAADGILVVRGHL